MRGYFFRGITAGLDLPTPSIVLIIFMGFLTAFLAALLGASKDMVSKRLAFNIPGRLSAFASFAFALPFYTVLLMVLYLAGLEDFAFSLQFLWLVLLRSLTDTFAEWSKMEAYSRGDISLVACFISLSPLFLLLVSPVITGDPLTLSSTIGVCLSVTGSVILIYPSRREPRPTSYKGILLGLAAAFFFSLNSSFDRLAVQVASPALSGFGMTMISALFLFPVAFRKGGHPRQLLHHARPFWLRGSFEVAFMVMKLSALQYLPAPHVAGILQCSLLISIIGGRLFFKEQQFGKRMSAGIFIVAGVLFILLG